ncbi:response regulator [Phenylobacterium sp.]|jgi:CheY-like chemotaxis protein|uniref:response regulator n=1 Tax=Phenylobacterium sp. TaxID=1871053 RepID=UPI002F94E85C
MAPRDPPDVLIVEDELLVAADLQCIIQDIGLHEVGLATTRDEAISLARRYTPDLALVDVHLQDGPTGVDAARLIAEDCGGVVLFMTANVRRLPPDFAGACGVIGKPYSEEGVRLALRYLWVCLTAGYAPGPPPVGLTLSPEYQARWAADLPMSA